MVLAERLSSQLGLKCLVVDKREHIGGNAHDRIDDAGVLVHNYGPHYFRTNSEEIVKYLSKFTEWVDADYKVQSFADDKFWSFPVNLKTFEQIIGRPSSEIEFKNYLEGVKVDFGRPPQNSEEAVLARMGLEFYEKFFLGYTKKQWACHPRDLDPSVCSRIPIRTKRDDRYLSDRYQMLPKEGYTNLFEKMIEASPGLQIELGSDFQNIRTKYEFDRIIYSGTIDDYFNRCYGGLPYRSLRFEHESFSAEQLKTRESVSGKKGFWQREMQINYPGNEEYTRIVEIKHATKQVVSATSIVREFPRVFEGNAEPYYPIPNKVSKYLYSKYKKLAIAERNVCFVGRLGTYKYYNMDQVVGMALSNFRKIENQKAK